MNEEQTTKLACDAYAFAETARLIRDHRDTLGACPGTTAHYSLGTAMVVNIGLAMELNLKLLHHKVGLSVPPEELKIHSLVGLHDLLDGIIQSRLTASFEKVMQECITEGMKLFSAYIVSTKQPQRPAPLEKTSTLRGLLAYLDEVTLFLRRYSFEKFSVGEWWIEPNLDFLGRLMSEVSQFPDSTASAAS